MDSDFNLRHCQQQNRPVNSGLMRFRSAPSSCFTNLLGSGSHGGEDSEKFPNSRALSPETEQIITRLMSSEATDSLNSRNPSEIERNRRGLFESGGSDKHEQGDLHSKRHHHHHHHRHQQQQQQQQMICQTQIQPCHGSVASTCAMGDSFVPATSIGFHQLAQMKLSNASKSNLIRHSSSPAGFFSPISMENGCAVMREMENFGAASWTTAESSLAPTKRLRNHLDFSSELPSSSSLLGSISEIGGKSTNFPNVYWDDPSILSDPFLKELEDSERNAFPSKNSSENQNDEGKVCPPTRLTHHLSLPASLTELSATEKVMQLQDSAMEKVMQLQDSVPFKIRAKRGCATHPRSIAERERRIRISARMRKLQELVPNMDKQTNTADMLDLAVDYIKNLKKEVETLSGQKARCTCSHKWEP